MEESSLDRRRDFYSDLRQEHIDRVKSNQIRIDRMWGQAVVAYNVQIVLSPAARGVFDVVQRMIIAKEPGALLLCPPYTLHISVAWLVAARPDYDGADKIALWQSVRDQSVGVLQEIADSMLPFEVTFEQIIATDAAIITLALDDGTVESIRDELRRRVPLSSKYGMPKDIIHCTLFRYGRQFADPEGLIDALSALSLDQKMLVDALQINNERVYPSLVSVTEFEARPIQKYSLG